jgi:hypothetical protein
MPESSSGLGCKPVTLVTIKMARNTGSNPVSGAVFL